LRSLLLRLGLFQPVFQVNPLWAMVLRLLCVVCFAAGFFIFADFIPWRRFVRFAIVVVGVLAGYRLLFPPPTYIYLIPGRGLGENSKDAPRELIARRVFVVEQSGTDVLYDVEITLHDDHATDQTAKDHIEQIPEIDPHDLHLKNAQPKHFWFAPSTPWNESYTITILSRENSWIEKILVRGFAAPNTQTKATATHGDSPLSPDLGKVEFAIRLTEVGKPDPLFTCQDKHLAGTDTPAPCSFHTSDIPSFEAGLDPKPFVLGFPTGIIDMTPNLPAASFASHPETEPDNRRLTEWQRQQIKTTLDRYPHQKVLILVAGGPNTWRYAHDFRDVFRQATWKVKGPVTAPHTDQVVTDVQISTWGGDFNHARSKITEIRDAFRDAGIKGADGFVCDPSVGPDAIVLWVGTKSPNDYQAYIGGKFPSHPGITSPDLKKLLADFH
jgi:hypothetical protein